MKALLVGIYPSKVCSKVSDMVACKMTDLKKIYQGQELGVLKEAPPLAQPLSPLWQGVQEQHHRPVECHLLSAVQMCL